MIELEQWKFFVSGVLYALAIFGIMVASFPAYIMFVLFLDSIIRTVTRAHHETKTKIETDGIAQLKSIMGKDNIKEPLSGNPK